MNVSRELITCALASLIATTALAGNQGTIITIDKTATSTITQTDTYSWTLQKTLKPDQVPYIIRPGQALPVEFLLTATRSGPITTYDSSPVAGQICIHNTGAKPTVGLWLTDKLEQSTDGGATWTPFAGPMIIPVTDLAAGASQCYTYSFSVQLNPLYLYRNIATATIDNFIDFEGMAHSVDAFAAVVVDSNLVQVGLTANLEDVFTCPSGFTCDPLTSTMSLTDSIGPVLYPVSLSNVSAACGQTLSGLNTATLTPSGSPALPPAMAAATIYTGTCHP